MSDLILDVGYFQAHLKENNPNKDLAKLFGAQNATLGLMRGQVFTLLSTSSPRFSAPSGNSYILFSGTLLPLDSSSSLYNNGAGVTITVLNSAVFNNLLVAATSVNTSSAGGMEASQALVVQNGSNQIIVRGTVVRVLNVAVDGTITVARAAAVNPATSGAFGVASEGIAPGNFGTVVTQGPVVLDTTAFSFKGEPAYLLNFAGQIGPAPGNTPVQIGKIGLVDAVAGVLDVACLQA